MSRGLWLSLDRLPRFFFSEDGVEDAEHFSHAGHQGHLLAFAGLEEPLVMIANGLVVARGHEGRHIEGGAYGRAATPDGPLSAELAAVAVQRSDAHQGRDLLSGTTAQLRQLHQQRQRGLWPDARNAPQQILLLT